jgi:hypothetical protein
VLVSRLQGAPGTNPGWIATGGAVSSVVGQVNIRVCNDGASAVPADPPDLLVSFIALGP